MSSQLNATIIEKIELTPELYILRIKPDVGVPDFVSGQYVALGLPEEAPRPSNFPPQREPEAKGKLIKRAYSIGSSPDQKEYIELYIAIVPEGALTPRLVPPESGSRVFLAPKITGTFTLNAVPDTANLVLVSTGTGIAPFISMLRTSKTWTPGRQITIVHGVRYPKDLAYQDELRSYSDEKKLLYLPVVSRADSQWGGERGHVQGLFDRELIRLDPETDHVFLCGNPAMIEDMEKLLIGKGYLEHTRKQPGNMHLEKYW